MKENKLMKVKNLLILTALFFICYLFFNCTSSDQEKEKEKEETPDYPGKLDASFNPGTGINDTVCSIVEQSDDKILIGGFFTTYNGISKNYIARLNANGSLDISFDTGTGTDGSIQGIAEQTDDKIIIVGGFTNYTGTARNFIARLNSNGSIDATFNPGTGTNGALYYAAIQDDGKIIIGGDFSNYNGSPRNNIARININGSIDTSFNPGTGSNGPIFSLTIQSDGKILITGMFTSYNNTSRNYFTRINADGSLDAAFDTGTGLNSNICCPAVQDDGKIIIGGGFTNYNGTSINCIARLNANGSIDSSFNPGTGANDYISGLGILSSGKIIIVGGFTSYNGSAKNNIAGLNSDGSLDTSFNPGAGANNSIYRCAVQSDGKIIIGGFFSLYNGIARNGIARILY